MRIQFISLTGRQRFGALAALGALTVAAVAGDGIQVYRVAKEKPPELAQMKMPAGHPDMNAATATQAPLTWQTPAGWTAVKPGELRVASFSIKDEGGKQADVSVIPLSGMAGGDFANVNRWRSQVGLPAITAAELKKLASNVEVSGEPADLYEFSGTNPSSGDKTRILAAVQHRDRTAWFFKMTGDDAVVEKQKEAFIAFLKSAKFAAPPSAGELPPAHPPIDGSSMPPGHPDISGTSSAAESAVAKEGQPQWTVPAGWKEIPGGQFLVAKFLIAGDGGAQAAINVSTSVGDGGGLAANVNRWRGQLGLPPATEAELQKDATTLETSGGKATLVKLSGTDGRTGQPTKLIGAVLVRDGQAWFYKLMGDEKIVAAQSKAFTKFVKEVKY
ncbi:MAG: hypothetical protein EPO07_08410 [Verrucomicrobia bacterium]|nr:MAG: hypothetical protein EPO07_08410 [Verrucomicrobiota bacterium]